MERTGRLEELLQDAMVMAEASPDAGIVMHLREAGSLLRRWTETTVSVRVDVPTGRVFSRGLPLALPRSELALVMALAIHDRGRHRDVLTEDLYPDLDPRSAANAIKVTVHRVRRRVGISDVIRHEGGTYRLGDTVDVDLFRVEAELKRLRLNEDVTSEQCDFLRRVRQRILDGRPAFMLDWAWFDETERRLRDIALDITIVLGRRALRHEQYQKALELAGELARDDPLEEAAADIAIRAFLLAGNRTAAVLEYRRYASILRREGDVPPSREIRALIEQM